MRKAPVGPAHAAAVAAPADCPPGGESGMLGDEERGRTMPEDARRDAETTAARCRRLAAELRVIARGDGDLSPGAAVHRARRILKRLRALAGQDENDAGARAARRALAAAARLLAEARDLRVAAATAQRLARTAATKEDRRVLRAGAAQLAAAATSAEPASLDALRLRLADLPLDAAARVGDAPDADATLRLRARASYRKARRRIRAGLGERDLVELHEARKAIGRCRRQLEGLAAPIPAEQRATAALDRLEDGLGLANDLYMLTIVAGRLPALAQGPFVAIAAAAAQRALGPHIARLSKSASRVFAQKPHDWPG